MSKMNVPFVTQRPDIEDDVDLGVGELITVVCINDIRHWYQDVTWEIVDGCLVVFDRDTEAIASYAPTTWTHVVAVTIEADDQEGAA